MDSSLLATKLRIPPRTRHHVRRAALVDALERAILDSKLVLISAPAGYGKTTLVSQWAEATSVKVAWLSVGKEDNDVERFFRYLLTAWEQVQPGLGESPLGLLLGALSPDSDAVLAAFINAANDVPDHTVFVLDDHHLLADASIHVALTFLLDNLPPTLHFVLAGRGEPPLPLARYRARHELREFQTEDLGFSVEETGEFLRCLMGLDLPPAEVVSLHAQLEGWVAGLQLVSLTLRRPREATDPPVVGGRHRFIADYLSEDVLAHQPDAVRRFLLQTSTLDRLCGSLCDAVTGKEGSQEVLELLERENLFLVPLDDRREWFRYHRLFADFLREELRRRDPDEVIHLHRRAARWYLAHDLPEPAFRHAVDGDDVELVIEIAERYFAQKLFGGEFRLVERWLASVPAAWFASHPMLGLAQVTFLVITGAIDAGVRCLNRVEQRLVLAESDETRWQLARIAAYRCFVACFQNDLARAETFARQALQDLREEDLSFRAHIHHALGDTYRGNGLWKQAKASYLKVLNFAYAPDFRILSAHVFGALADLELRQGRLRDAAAHWSKALAAVQERENWGRLPLPVIGWVYLRMGELLYERNELAEAREHLSRGLDRAEVGGDARALFAGHVLAARLKLTEGDVEAAAEYLERARPPMEQASFPDWTSRFERCQLDLWRAQNRPRVASDWADAMLRSDALRGRPESEVAQLAVISVLIVKGDAPARERAMAQLERLLQAADAEGRVGVQIEALALRALAVWRAGDRAGAMTALERSLRLAEPEGYVRLFADLGLPMARLLQEARSRDVMPDYVATLLAAISADPALPAAREGALPEPLSVREQEVLTLLAAGLTNREIAEALVISPETVKKHAGSIYGKLGVGHRTEAVARARALALLV